MPPSATTWLAETLRALAMSGARLSFVLHIVNPVLPSQICSYIPKYASLSLKPRLPWSKLLCVTASHLTSSSSTLSPPGPSIRTYASSSLLGSSLTLNTPPFAAGRILKGACMRGGVCCHRGRSAAWVSYSGARAEAVVEKAHAEVRTTAGREALAQRSDGAVAEESKLRVARFDAIAAYV
jgi:hypothetical protein